MLNSSKIAKITKTNIVSDNEIDVSVSYRENFDTKKDYLIKIIQIHDENELNNIVSNFKNNKNLNNELIKNKSKLTYIEYDFSIKNLKEFTDLRFKLDQKFDDLDFLAYLFLVYVDESKIANKLKIKNLNKLNSVLRILEFDYQIIKEKNSIKHRSVIEKNKLSKKPEIKDFFYKKDEIPQLQIVSEIFTSYVTEKETRNYFYIYPQNLIQKNTFYPDFFQGSSYDIVIDVFVTDKLGNKIKCKTEQVDKAYICQFEDRIAEDKDYVVTITFKDLSVSFFEEIRPEILKYLVPLSNIISLSNDDRFYNFEKQEFNYSLIKANADNIYFVIERLIYINNIVSKQQLSIEDFVYITNKSISFEDIYILIDRLKSLLAIVDQIYLNYNLKNINSIDVKTFVKYNFSNMLFSVSSFEEDIFKINNIKIDNEVQNIQLENFENVNRLYLKNINKFSYEDAMFDYGYKQLSTTPKFSNYISLSNISNENRDVLYRSLKKEYENTYLKLYFNKAFKQDIEQKELNIDEYSLIYILNNIEYKLFYWDTVELEWKKVVSNLKNNTLCKLEEYNKPNFLNSKIVNQYFLV